MNDEERRRLIDALDNEGAAQRSRILATFDNFRNWMMLAFQLLYRKIKDQLRMLWNFLRNW